MKYRSFNLFCTVSQLAYWNGCALTVPNARRQNKNLIFFFCFQKRHWTVAALAQRTGSFTREDASFGGCPPPVGSVRTELRSFPSGISLGEKPRKGKMLLLSLSKITPWRERDRAHTETARAEGALMTQGGVVSISLEKNFSCYRNPTER